MHSFISTKAAHNPNLQVVITHAWHVCSQHSFGLPLNLVPRGFGLSRQKTLDTRSTSIKNEWNAQSAI